MRFAAFTGIMLILGTGTAPAQAAAPQTSFSRSPDRGPRGTVIKVSGSGCTDNGRPWEYAYVYFASVSTEPGKKYSKASAHFPVHADGSWEGEFTVPADAPLGDYTVLGSCSASDMDRECGRAPFTVTEASTPTTAPTTTAPPPPPPPGMTIATTTSTTAPPKTMAVMTTTSVSTTTTSTAPAITTTDPALPDDGTDSAAPAVAIQDDEDGGGTPWGWAAAAVIATGGGALAASDVRRRRRATAGEPQEAT